MKFFRDFLAENNFANARIRLSKTRRGVVCGERNAFG
jgi:hypothetical protein